MKGTDRVKAALKDAGLAVHIRTMDDTTRSAQEAADAIGCSVAEIAKSLVFQGKESGRPVLAILSGVNRLDTGKLEYALGEAVRRPDAAFVKDHTGFSIGGVSPLGHRRPMPVFFDEDLLAYPTVWASAGHTHAVFEVKPAALLRASSAIKADLKA